MSNVTYYFEIGGMTCSGCSDSIRNSLELEKYVRDKVDINLATHRARVTVEEGTNPSTIVKAIEELGFDAKWLTFRNEKTFYYGIKGLRDPKEANLIEETLNKNRAYIKSCKVNYSTNTISVTTFTSNDEAKQALLDRQIKIDIQSVVSSPNVSIKSVEPPKNDVLRGDNPKVFYRKAVINAIAALPWILLASFIPPPVTLLGQAIGVVIGGATLGIMYKTGKEFYADAWHELIKNRSSNMNTLIALGTGSAWFYSMILVLMPWLFPVAALQYQFLAVNMILFIVNFGKGLRAQAQERSKDQSQSLAEVSTRLQPQYVKRCKFKPGQPLHFERDVEVEEIEYCDINKDDIIQVKKDERFPVEGIILNDVETFVNQETLTGESKACNKKQGDEVFSGSLNTKNTVYIQATCKGKEGHLSRVLEDVAKATSSKSSISKLVDRLAVIFVPTIVSLSALTALGWYLLGPVPQIAFMLKSAISVLLYACPCALGLATPISTTIGIYKLFNKGILVHNASALEAAAQVDTVVFDKTGTLTTPVISEFFVEENQSTWSRREILRYVASLEQGLDHPIAKSFERAYVNQKSMQPLYQAVLDSAKHEQGVSGKVNGKDVLVGNLSYLESRGIKVSDRCKEFESQNAKNGKTSIYVSIDKQCVSVVGLHHDRRDDAIKAIEDLQKLNVDIFMLTGDEMGPAQAVANKLGIRKVYANHNADMKKKFIANLRRAGRVVAMVGDGFNDLKPIDEADVGIALGSWTNASATADIALQNLNVATMLIIAKQTMRNIRQNLLWTAFYNIFGIIAASGLLYPFFGFILNPIMASALMAVSSIFVVMNSSRLFYAIDEVVGLYEGVVTAPKTWLQKLLNFLSLDSLFQTIHMLFFTDKNSNNNSTNSVPDSCQAECPPSPTRKRPVIFESPQKRMKRTPSRITIHDNGTYQEEIMPASPVRKLNF
ncbi:MAG: heavy metal translocating P-type ATPase [Candidatus Berkiella sp.]